MTLQSLGIDLETFGGGMFKVRSVPALLSHTSPQAIIATIVSDLENGKVPGQEALEERIVKRICKQVAVKAGQVLSLTRDAINHPTIRALRIPSHVPTRSPNDHSHECRSARP
ncbi:MAG UNVERIFIED_CONTAM: hypothetical protein LVT10_08900 [Anaerolineae bacterium]